MFGPLPPPYGGVSVFVEGLSEAVIDRGGQVWTYTGGRERYPDNPLFVDHRRLGHIAAALTGSRNGRITDSAHFHLEYPNRLLLPVWLLAKRLLGFRWIKIVHDGSLPSRQKDFGKVRRLLFRAAVRNIDEFVAASPELASWLAELGIERSRISIIPTLLPRWFGPGASPELSDAPKEFLLHRHRLCSIGVFIPSYGFHHVVEAVERIRSGSNMNIGLLLIDGTFARDEDYREQVLRGRDWITVNEDVPNPEIPQVLSRCDAFIRATEHEGFGISRVEALWSGVPVIATDVGERRGMLLYDFGDVEALAVHIRSVLEGKASPDAAEAASTLRKEAQRNLHNYVDVIMGDL